MVFTIRSLISYSLNDRLEPIPDPERRLLDGLHLILSPRKRRKCGWNNVNGMRFSIDDIREFAELLKMQCTHYRWKLIQYLPVKGTVNTFNNVLPVPLCN